MSSIFVYEEEKTCHKYLYDIVESGIKHHNPEIKEN
jgi:hypothetical protein